MEALQPFKIFSEGWDF